MARELLYKKAETEIRRRISDSEWPVGMRLGNEFELAEEFKVSQGTMRRALMTLEADGLLSRKPGRGTVVAAVSAVAPKGEPRQLRSVDGTLASFEIHRAKSSIRDPEGEEAALFGGARVHHTERLLKFGGARAALEEVILPVEVSETFDEDASVDLHEALRVHGVAPAQVDEALSAQMTTMSDSVTLSCDRNTALLCITRVARDSEGKPLARQVIRVADPDIVYG